MAITARTILLLLLPALASCASAPPHVTFGVPPGAPFESDRAACEMEANKAQMSAWGAPRYARESMANSIAVDCMRARGYRVNL